MSMNYNNNNRTRTYNPHWKRGVMFLITTAILIMFIVFQIQDYYHDIDRANQAVKDSSKLVELAKQRVAEAQARLNYDLNN